VEKIMMRTLVLGFAVALAACGSARIVSQNPRGGVIELQGDHAKAKEQAMLEMNGHCGAGNFTIQEEVVGRIYYRCNVPTTGPAPAPGGPPPPSDGY
jgi:hypothetical protein